MKINISAFLLLFGLVSGALFRYHALEASRFTLFLVFLLVFLNFLAFQGRDGNLVQKWKIHLRSFWKVAFVSFLFQTSLQFLLARILGLNEKLLVGVVVASLCPYALVAPQFCKDLGGDPQKSILYVLVSHLIFPALVPLGLWMFRLNMSYINFRLLFLDAVLVTVFPICLVLILGRFQTLRLSVISRWGTVLPWLNMFIIGFIAFTSMGAFLTKSNWESVGVREGLGLFAIALMQDFGSLLIGRFFAFEKDEILMMSIKNVALACGISLIYFPGAALPSLVIFPLHSVIFLFYRRIFSSKFTT